MSAAPAAAVAYYPLETKPDALDAYRRWDAWWQGEIIDRAPVTINVRNERPVAGPRKTHASLRERWFDLEHRLACHATGMEGRTWLAETFPSFMPNLGPEVMATLYGAELDFTEDSSWAKPVYKDCHELLAGKADLDTPYWQWIRRATDLSLEMGRHRWITAITDLHSNGDQIAALRDPQHVLLEMAEDPEAVAAGVRHIAGDFARCYEDLASRIRAAGQPVMSWTPIPVHGRGLVLQCDLICMMGPKAFRSMILPAIRGETEALDHSIFHLDGPQALRHLDDLLALPRLDAIQWVYGAGNGPASKWMEVYRRVQAAGKSNQICCEDLQDAERVMQAMKPKGVWLQIGGEYPLDVAQAFLGRVENWSMGA